ncbi:MAG: hypothetical protein QXW39_08720 [Candidatus Bathyarchaeia archaeon]
MTCQPEWSFGALKDIGFIKSEYALYLDNYGYGNNTDGTFVVVKNMPPYYN